MICCEGNAGFYEIGMMGTPVAGTGQNQMKITLNNEKIYFLQLGIVFLDGTTQDFLAPQADLILTRQLFLFLKLKHVLNCGSTF